MICLWKTDGTSGGTTLLSSINNQTNKTQINYSPSYTIANNTLYFVVNHFSSTDYNAKIDYVELWKSDGTISGTVKIKDFKPKGNMLFNLSNLKTFNNKVIFVWDDQNKVELWISDGTETGTYKLKDTQSNYNISLAATDKYLYFTQGSSIWVTDGTVNGTHQCKNFVPNVNDYISNLTNVNNTIFFTLSTYSHYRHLYKITSDK
jgi:ELWxxDGT repeat protein